MLKNKRLLFLLICSVILNLVIIESAVAIEIDGHLTTEISYSKLDKMRLPLETIISLENNLTNNLNLNILATYDTYQYSINLKQNIEDNNLEVEEATINTIIGDGILEFGKKDWTWGKAFSYYPTYPLNSNKKYIGSELSYMGANSTFKVGASLDSNAKKLYSSWIKLNSLLATSDYTLICSYLKDNSEEQLYSNNKNS